MNGLRRKFVSAAVASLFLASAGNVLAASPAQSSASLARIVQAASDNFSSLKGEALEHTAGGDHVWAGKENPFGLFCDIREKSVVGSGYSYECDTHGYNGGQLTLSEAQAEKLSAKILAAFQRAEPGWVWHQDSGGLGAFVGGVARGQYSVSIRHFMSSVSFHVDAVPFHLRGEP